jgi:hypothetical protein
VKILAGYSGTPLAKKLGLKEGGTIVVIGAPRDFVQQLAPMPADAKVATRARSGMGLALIFVKSREELEARFAALAASLDDAGMLWVAWPKKASGVATDVTENAVRAIGLAARLVDNKVCAIDDVWSGLRFQYRLKDRQKR